MHPIITNLGKHIEVGKLGGNLVCAERVWRVGGFGGELSAGVLVE